MFDLIEVVGGGVSGLERVAREGGVAEHRGEEVVEIVRDAAAEDAEAFEFLRLEEVALEGEFLGFGGLQGGDVDGETFEEAERAGVGEDGAAADEHPFLAAVAVADAILDFEAAVVGDGFSHVAAGEGAVHAAAEKIGGAETGEREEALGAEEEREFLIEHAAEGGAGELAEEVAELAAAFVELGFGAFAGGDIGGDAAEGVGLAVAGA